MKDKIVAYIKEEISNEPIEFIELDDDLLGSGIIDSLGIMQLIVYVENEFDIKIPTEDMTVENFMTLQKILNFLGKNSSV